MFTLHCTSIGTIIGYFSMSTRVDSTMRGVRLLASYQIDGPASCLYKTGASSFGSDEPRTRLASVWSTCTRELYEVHNY